ncbi:MAG: hypothetical protein ACNA8W_17560, partial [Bradymonadaceae bacterium]
LLMMMRRKNMISALLLASSVLMVSALGWGCDNSDPGFPYEQPLYRWGEPDQPSSAERGNILINEVGFAGSVSDNGVHDADDVFIEILNKHPRPLNFSGWHLNVRGDYERSYRLPQMNFQVSPNDYMVIAAKRDGAFADVADVFLEDLKIGKKYFYIELRDSDKRLIESAGSTRDRVFSGGYDLVTTRSMERTQVLFGNRGGESRNWHANVDDARNPEGSANIREGWRKFTWASPGAANSEDYAGSTSSGTFE